MAILYDKFMQDAPYDLWISFTEEVINQYGKNVSQIADLGCGTGEITKRLAQKGYHMTGVDYSAEMLTIAEQKASEDRLSIRLIHQDLRELEGLADIDAVVSYCDVINYITETSDLEKVFQNIADCLIDGGLLIFDMHSMNHVEENLVNHTFADVTEDSSYIWYCTEGEQPGEMYHDLTFFLLDEGTHKYTRFDETHHQRTYPIHFYVGLLKKLGFININFYGDFSLKSENLHENSERIFITAEKGSR
ncbi:class I SAM-dependent DNA methyltransferase [Ornithinibacillus salinisoli]